MEQCFCPSYFDNDGVLQNCQCGKCGTENLKYKPFDYSNIPLGTVSFTTTWRTPTKKEDEREIIELSKEIQKLKWYEFDKRKRRRRIINSCAYRLNNIHNKRI